MRTSRYDNTADRLTTDLHVYLAYTVRLLALAILSMVRSIDQLITPPNDHSHPCQNTQLAADGLAAGFLDLGLQPGDTIAAWLPAEDVDLHITQFGAAKAGLTLAVLDESITREGIEKTLTETGAKALIYAPYRGNTDNTALLQQIVPELASCESLVM